MADAEPSFFVRHDFLIRRLHSLTGLVFGAYVCVHFLTNASILGGVAMFQSNVLLIHSLGPLLPVVEWVFIFLPILFHAIVGLAITAGMVPNNHNYPYGANWRYTVQRITGLFLFLFIFYHVFHMHGWFHFDAWISLAERWGGYQFRPYNAASSAGLALQNMLVALIYLVAVVAAAFHFFNGIWSAGITWGVWTHPRAQQRALSACMVGAVLLVAVGFAAVWGLRDVGRPGEVEQARAIEDRMHDSRIEAGLIQEDEHKRAERK